MVATSCPSPLLMVASVTCAVPGPSRAHPKLESPDNIRNENTVARRPAVSMAATPAFEV